MSNKPLLPARRREIARSVVVSMSRINEIEWFTPTDKHAALIAAWSMGLVKQYVEAGTFWIGKREVTDELYELTGWDERA